ncbi:Os05g0283600 [Oryza sativa Japonica Group]|jgi:hypothetical protein|uniref:Os05g0283600 protein n=1 Tax=Oryza sativa subsp. japonica TaxID=39947 RepID=C7J2L3_ORYSJ|nr:Os05g0283600 [Oryza sativa Japonica Group]|eukprot:NP_001174321.1 Os05g0283600 [Oryza sativa Japonica Group]
MPRRRSSSLTKRTLGGSGSHASGSGGNDRGLVIHRVVKEAGGAANYPVLTKTNYNEWSLLMKIKLQARCLTACGAPLIREGSQWSSMKIEWRWTPFAAPSPSR